VRHIRLSIVALLLIMLPVSPAQAEDIWSQLRDERGLVVLMRHAIAPGGGDPAGFRLGDCRTQRNLSTEGRTQARAIGKRFKEERILISSVRSSRWCRATQTARLLDLGPVRPTAAFDSVFTASNEVARQRQRQAEQLIERHRGRSGVLVMVGHQANIIDLTGIAPASGGAVVVRADRAGKVRVIGQIPPPPVRQ
jgi:phosphohistidine phosphatase SixA